MWDLNGPRRLSNVHALLSGGWYQAPFGCLLHRGAVLTNIVVSQASSLELQVQLGESTGRHCGGRTHGQRSNVLACSTYAASSWLCQ